MKDINNNQNVKNTINLIVSDLISQKTVLENRLSEILKMQLDSSISQ